MKKYLNLIKKIFLILITTIMVFSIMACGGSDNNIEVPLGGYKNTFLEEEDGVKPVDGPYMGYGEMTFNEDGTGTWNYALDTDITWKLKGDNITIIETYEGQEETYKGKWDGEKMILDIWGYKYTFEKLGSASTNKPENIANNNLVGFYDCTGSKMNDNDLDPMGEWLQLEDDGSGTWFLGATENNFKWLADGSKINFDVEVVGQTSTLQYTANVEDEKIILDTGMLYYFTKQDGNSEQTSTGFDKGADVDWGKEANGEILIPSSWYGVAIFENCEGFDFEEIKYDVWAIFDIDSTGTPYLEMWLDSELKTDFIFSMYIADRDKQWLYPVIGDDDAWIKVDSSTQREQTLTADDEWGLMAQYDEGAIDIYHVYNDEEGGYADCRFFIRENGIAWNEESDPLPPGFDNYKSMFGSNSNN